MATAFFPLGNLIASFQALAALLLPRRAPQRAQPERTAAATQPLAPAHAAKPLRIVRVLEPSAPRAIAGRMVISGRLADVCAELDRLAALETQRC